MEALDRFPDEEAGIAHLEAVVWPKDPMCAKLDAANDALGLSRPRYRYCRFCRAQLHVRNGAPSEATHWPLRTWFAATFLTATSCKGICDALHREMGKLMARAFAGDCGNVMGDNRSAVANAPWDPEEWENRAGNWATRTELENRRLAPMPVVETRIVAGDWRYPGVRRP
jgi:hypothetical protein